VTFSPRISINRIRTIGADNKPPTLTSQPVTSAPAERPLTVIVETHDPSGIKSVSLRYRSVNQYPITELWR
jgi:hypothetical protein